LHSLVYSEHMTKQHFTFKEVFKFGWLKTKQHAWFIALTAMIVFIVMGSVHHVPVLELLIALFIGLSIVSISLTIARDQSFSFSDLYKPLLSPYLVLKFLALTAIYAIAVAIGLLLFILPGLYLAVRFKMFPYVLIENEHATLKELIKMTNKLTQSAFWKVLGFLILVSIFNILGALVFLVGLVVTVPVSIFATAHMYEKLKNRHTA
jgi:uncharacterized membrane protein